MLTGACFCGFVRYETTGQPFHSSNCHCSMCRRSTGAPYVAWFSVARSTFRFTRGELAYFRSSPLARRGFCPRCGTQITFEDDGAPSDIDLTTCSLDDPDLVPPTDDIHTGSKVGWVKLDEMLPEYEEFRRAG